MWSLSDVGLAFAPAVVWLWYVRREDLRDPEPRLLVFFAFVLGCGAANVVGLLRPRIEALAAIDGPWSGVIDAYVVTAAPEELAKLSAALLASAWSRHWDEPMDGIVYGVAAGLGFAGLENVYFLTASGDPLLVVGRAFTANLAHAAFTGGACFFIGLARLGHSHGTLLAAVGIGGAIVLHGTYDVFLFALPRFNLVALLLVLPLALALLGLKVRWAQAARKRFGTTGTSTPIRSAGRSEPIRSAGKSTPIRSAGRSEP